MAEMTEASPVAQQVADAVRRAVAARRCLPVATYRLQFQRDRLTFRDAAALVPYLHDLGVSHVYASPYRQACAASLHGYAIVDYNRLNPELGTDEDYRAFVAAMGYWGMGHILDIVPNHMHVASGENAWWNDVLENGPGSPYASYFDIDWQPVKEELQNKVLLPLLGDSYGRVLESGELKLEYRRGAFFVRYCSTALPLDPQTTTAILVHRLAELQQALPKDSPELRELESIITALNNLPDRLELDPGRVAERQREKEVIKDRLDRLVRRSPEVAAFVQENLRQFSGVPGDPPSLDRLERLLDAQVYRLAHWRTAADEINYRRFFDINALAAVCTEDAKVFEDCHRLLFEMLARGDIFGLRVDHVDGLYDPTEYLWRLQWSFFRALGRATYEGLRDCAVQGSETAVSSGPSGTGPSWEEVEPLLLECLWPMVGGPPPREILAGGLARPPGGAPDGAAAETSASAARGPEGPPAKELPLYVIVEKILDPKEPLPADWAVAGTTGYNFLDLLSGLYVDPAGLEQLNKIYARFIDAAVDPREVTYQSKLLILRVAMASELQLLAHRLNRISEKHRLTRDFTLNSLRVALREIIAAFPVYRTYVRKGQVAARDRQVIQRAVAQAKLRNPARSLALFDFVRDVLLLEQPPGLDPQGQRERDLFVGRFQQVTSPVVAKGVEDTAFYRYFPLASLNEVGGVLPGKATTLEEFHAENLARQAERPDCLICTTTHDTKRSEDVRARIHVLAEIPQLWRTALNRWARLNRRHRLEVDGQPAPSRNDEYLFYQTLVGVWPLEPPDRQARSVLVERLQQYMEKATREAKVRTSWINPNPSYDAAVRQFVAATLKDHPKNRFLAEFCAFHDQVVNWGLYTAVSQAFLKLISPGVPDIYQGQEIWDFSLVDPDNRRPVNFWAVRAMLDRLRSELSAGEGSLAFVARRLGQTPRDPLLKLFVTWRTLQFRRTLAELARRGEYLPLRTEGAQQEHVCAFAWRLPGAAGLPPRVALVVAPRRIAKLTPLTKGEPYPVPPYGESVWKDTMLVLDPLNLSGTATNVFTGDVLGIEGRGLPLARILAEFPVALLACQPAG